MSWIFFFSFAIFSPKLHEALERKTENIKNKACLGIGSVDSQIYTGLQNKSEIQDTAISPDSAMVTDTKLVCIGGRRLFHNGGRIYAFQIRRKNCAGWILFI
ncbi:hypothetical protein CEXT_650461 [Caerostris extrusa]|uniref:Uncharacterized protein n=1 Tax=Caerostris extrusa TaxID=172846 RepID=A0AAV4MVQ8_CAEEX|nr:hypothetical protein CEXT_650461 [Caerostris extrusa]